MQLHRIPVLLVVYSSLTQAAGTTLSFTQSHEALSNGYSAWSESSLLVRSELAPRQGLSGGVQATRRFGLNDTQFSAGYTHPLDEQLTLALDVAFSPTHEVLARHTIAGSVQYEFLPAWLLHAGARTTEYDAARVNQGVLLLEQYVASFSWMIGWRPARAFDTTTHSGEFRASYYYGDKNHLSLIVGAGKEATPVGSAVVLAQVSSGTVVGRHWFAPDWAILYSAATTRQGDFYTRNGFSIGLQHAF